MGDKATFEITVQFDEEIDKDRIEEYVWANFVPHRDEIEVRDSESGETVFSNKD